MTKSLHEELKEKYPEMYSNVYCGVSVGEGWYDLIRDMSAEIAPLKVKVAQVKEKFSMLRVYIDPSSFDKRTKAYKNYHKAVEIIRKYEHESGSTCEMCGLPGAPRDGGWIKTLCEEHSEGRDQLSYKTGTGQTISRVHRRTKDCEEYHCVIHNPSDHCMKDFPTHWRSDRGIMERICPHGCGHIDPDDYSFILRTQGEEKAESRSIHGCCGCCSPPKEIDNGKE